MAKCATMSDSSIDTIDICSSRTDDSEVLTRKIKCGQTRFAFDQDSHRVVWMHFYCWRWDCKYCAKRLRKGYLFRMSQHTVNGGYYATILNNFDSKMVDTYRKRVKRAGGLFWGVSLRNDILLMSTVPVKGSGFVKWDGGLMSVAHVFLSPETLNGKTKVRHSSELTIKKIGPSGWHVAIVEETPEQVKDIMGRNGADIMLSAPNYAAKVDGDLERRVAALFGLVFSFDEPILTVIKVIS